MIEPEYRSQSPTDSKYVATGVDASTAMDPYSIQRRLDNDDYDQYMDQDQDQDQDQDSKGPQAGTSVLGWLGLGSLEIDGSGGSGGLGGSGGSGGASAVRRGDSDALLLSRALQLFQRLDEDNAAF